MGKIIKQTDNRYLNMYKTEFTTRSGKEKQYFFASRARDVGSLKINGGKKCDGVDIVAVYDGKIVLVDQFRAPIGGRIYECPAGLIDGDETPREAAIRELHEETGLDLEPIENPALPSRGFYTSVGMSDEACALVFGRASGQVSREYLEDSEDIRVVLADRDEARRILAEETLSLRCALALMWFVSDGSFPV